VTPSDLPDPTLWAFVDGELAPDEAAKIEARAKDDAALAARIEQARALRRKVADAYADVVTETPPQRLLSMIEGGASVVDLGKARQNRIAWRPAAQWGAIAAGLAFAFLVGRFAMPAGSGGGELALGPDGLVARGALAQALDTQLASNQPASSPVKIGVSFRAQNGDYCRTFILDRPAAVAGLACKAASGWDVRMATPAAAPPGTVYQTAADETPAPVLEMVDQTIAGAPLDAIGEARARQAHWSR
jgi:hypothetical protein